MNKLKEARLAAGLSQAALSKKYGIPIRTIENWDSGKRIPSEWLENLLIRIIREDMDEKRVWEKVCKK